MYTTNKRPATVALLGWLAVALVLAGCSKPALRRVAAPAPTVKAQPGGVRAVPRNLSFTQHAFHNCGTIAMLISWMHARPKDAAALVRRLGDGSFIVDPAGAAPLTVTATELAAAEKAGVVETDAGDRWPLVVLTAFVKVRSGSGAINCKATDWIYAGEMGSFLTGGDTGIFDLKPESVDAKGRITVGKPLPVGDIKAALSMLQGKPVVAYTNRRIHIWALLDYDARQARVLLRNPRSKVSIWLPISAFAERFQMLVYTK